MNILITGATSGIGKQLVLDYLQENHHVYAVGRNQKALAELHEQGAETIAVNLLDKSAIKIAFSHITELDMVICGAGICKYIDMPTFNSDVMMNVFNTNIATLVHTIDVVLERLMDSKGRLVAIGSASAFVPFQRAEAYGSSKAALHYLMKTLTISLKPKGVAVSLVIPGFVDTPMTKQNNFSMPYLQTVNQASNAIRQGIANEDEVIEFPKKLTIPLKTFGMLPDGVWQSVSKRIYDK